MTSLTCRTSKQYRLRSYRRRCCCYSINVHGRGKCRTRRWNLRLIPGNRTKCNFSTS